MNDVAAAFWVVAWGQTLCGHAHRKKHTAEACLRTHRPKGCEDLVPLLYPVAEEGLPDFEELKAVRALFRKRRADERVVRVEQGAVRCRFHKYSQAQRAVERLEDLGAICLPVSPECEVLGLPWSVVWSGPDWLKGFILGEVDSLGVKLQLARSRLEIV